MKTLFSVIVPAYKQENTIVKDLRRIYSVISKLRFPCEMICVVDGINADNTFTLASRAFSKGYQNVKIVGYPNNKGKGHAVRYGMAKSKGTLIGFIDSGMDINPNGISMILEHFEWYNADIIVGSKRHPASKVNYPWQRKILSWGYQLLTRVLFGLNIRDTQVGLKCYRREVLEKVLPRLIVKTYAFDIEILAVARNLGFKRIYEAPVDVNIDFGGNSVITSGKLLHYIFKMLLDTLAVFYRLRLLNYYSDSNHRSWKYDPELNFRVNTV